MSISTTNRGKAYLKVMENITKRQAQVYSVICLLEKCSLQRIADYLGCERSDISGRVTELKNCFLIKEALSAESQRTGNDVTVYMPTTEEERNSFVISKKIELTKELNDLTDSLNLDLCSTSRKCLQKEIKSVKRKIKALNKVL